MKILLLKGIHPPKDGIVLPHQSPISLQSLKSNKFQSSVERAKKSATKPPKCESKTLLHLSLGNALQLLTLPNSLKLKQQLLELQSLSHLRLSLLLNYPFLNWIGWCLWWKGYMTACLGYHLSCIHTIIKFSFA